MLKYIINKGYDINTKNKLNGETVLIRSVHYNMKNMVEFLLAYNPDLEIRSTHVFQILFISLKNQILVKNNCIGNRNI